MKKLFKALVVFGAALAMTACAGGGSSSKPLEDPDHKVCLHGNVVLNDGTKNEWNGKKKDLYEKSLMTAISVADAKKIDANVGALLAKRNVKYLYKYEGLQIGHPDGGDWAAYFVKNQQFYKADGSFVFKAAQLDYIEEDDKYAEAQWIPDPKTAHVESLTPDTYFIPTWQEAADDYGLSWASNPVVTGGAGVYTVIMAQYKEVSAADVCGFGIAAIKTGDLQLEEGKTARTYSEPMSRFVVADHTYGVIGSFAGSGWSTDVAMTAVAGVADTYEATVTVAANDELKVRADGAWAVAWGASSAKVATAIKDNFDLEGDNIKALVAGSYKLTLKVNGGFLPTASISIAAA